MLRIVVMKNSLKSILAIFLILTLFLGGCGSGGFSETTANGSSATDPGASNTVFLIGQVRVPITASQSLLRASVSTVALAGADIDLFRPDDVARQNSLLASGAQIEAGADGRFALLKSQIRSTELSGTAVLVAKSENLVFSTLMELPGANSVVKDAVKVDYRTDAAVRFLQEEILKNAARAQNQAEIREAPWSDTVDSLASRIATVRNDLEGFLSNLPYNPANHGSSSGGAGRLFRQVAQGQSALSLIVEEGVRLEARAALEPIRPDEITLAEKRLRLASQFLLAGFTLLGEDGSLLWNQRFSRLEFSALPPTGFGASEADLEASFGGLVTTSDVQKWPLPANTLHFTVQELSALRPLGQQYEEFSVLMAREISRLPWVSMPILENLLALPSKNLLRLDSLFQAFSLGFEQRTWSVERVLTGLDSGGRIVPGEKVSASGAFGGLSVNPSSRLSMVIGLNSESSLDTFRNRLREAPEFWMQWLPASFRMAHHRLNELSQNIASSQAIYPDPISESSARFEVVRTLNGIQQYGSAQAEQGMELLLREAQILRHMILSATDSRLSSETLVNRIEIPVLAEFFAQLSPAFEPSTGLFTSIASNQGKTPNLDNLSVLSFRPSATETMWNQIFLRAGQSGVAETKNPQLKAMETSLATLRVTTLNWLRTIPSQAQNVELQGKVIKGGNLAAARFLMRLESDNLTTVVAQTSSDGSFSIKNLPGDRFYRLVVEARDVDVQSNPQANLVTMSFDFWLSGYEPVVELSDILLAPSFNALASNPISDFSRIVPANFLATIQTKNPDPVVSGIIPLQVLVCDDETDLVDLKFGFTVGDSLLVTTQAPRISVSNLPTATFPADGILRNLPSRTNAVCLTQPFTYYWHSRQDYGLGGNLGNASQQDVRISFSVREIGRTTEFDVASISGFFDLDNESPNLTFTHPLSTDPATTLAAIRLAGTAFDVSAVKSIWVSNASLRSGRTTTYAARDLGSGFGTWEVLDFPVEPGIENTVHFFAEDIFGNRNALPRELKFLSLDSAPPLLKLTSITVLGARNIPVLESVESGSALTIATVALGGGSIRYELPLTSDRSYRFNLLTTGLVEFAGTAVDVSGVFRVRANSTGFAAQSTDSVSYSWKRQVNLGTESLPFGSDSTSLRVILSAIDTKNNDSRPLSFQTALQNRQSTLLYVNLLDIEAPGIAILQPEGGRNAQTVTTDLITIRAAATDASRIVSFSACSVIACTSFQPVTGTMDFIGVLPLMEATSNRLTGLIADEWGYAQTFTMTSPLTILNLNDISPPSLIVTSVSDALIQPQLLPLVVDRNTPDSPRSSIQVLEVTRCASTQPGVSPTSCSVTLSGIMSDASGFDFASDGRNNLSGFRLRMNALNSGQFNPDTAQTRQDLYGASTVIFPNVGNTSMIQAFPVTATPVQTQVPFTATLSLKDDGYWPVVLQLFDNSINLFSGHEKKSIEKREMIYVKRDTTGPVLSELSLISGGSVTSGRILLNGAATDALSAVTSVEVGGVQGTGLLRMPFPR